MFRTGSDCARHQCVRRGGGRPGCRRRRQAVRKCSVCHSIAGKGNAKGPLDDVGKMPADDIRAWITDAKAMTEKTKAPRKPVMKQAPLPKGDVDALVAYLQTLKK